MDKETFYRLALIHYPNYGNANIKKLIQICGNATSMFEDHKQVAKKLFHFRANIQLPQMNSSIEKFVLNEIKHAQQHDIKICFFDDENYPLRLLNCSDSPYYFYYKGAKNFNTKKAIAIVGTRNASNYGKDVVKKIVEELAPLDVCVISGLARGIDTCAHEEALHNNLRTVAVLGCGLRTIYPEENSNLAKRILENEGTIISEYPFDTIPDRINFPKRNRIIAGMSDAVIVAESQEKGGSIITAEIAHSYNRDVFAVPGTIFQKSQKGCHELIRNNLAALVYSGENISEMMGWNTAPKTSRQRQLFIDLNADEEAILNTIRKQQGATIDNISNSLPQLNASKIAALLLSMELRNIVECKPGKIYTTIY